MIVTTTARLSAILAFMAGVSGPALAQAAAQPATAEAEAGDEAEIIVTARKR